MAKEEGLETLNSQANRAEDAFVESFGAKVEDGNAGAVLNALEQVEQEQQDEQDTDGSAGGGDQPDAAGTAEEPDAGSADAASESPEGDATETEPETPEPTEAEFDAAFTEAMAQQGATVTLDDVPAEARPLVQKKLKDLEAGFTRTMQQVRADQKEALAVRAEVRFQRERPVDFIVTLLEANPQLAEQVNARLDEFAQSPTAREYHGVIVEQARAKAIAAEEAAVAAQEQRAQRAQEIERMGRAAAQAAGVPYELGVEEAIIAHLVQHDGEIDAATITRIAKQKGATYRQLTRGQARAASAEQVARKVADVRKAAVLKAVPGKGVAPAPARAPKPKSDDEFVERFASQLR